jgi:hydrogenase/urease accessory protein HupE
MQPVGLAMVNTTTNFLFLEGFEILFTLFLAIVNVALARRMHFSVTELVRAEGTLHQREGSGLVSSFLQNGLLFTV